MDPLGADRPLTDELAAVAAARVAAARAIIHMDDVHEAMHEARRTAKELRALLRLVRPAVEGTSRKHNARLRDAARRLSDVRDAAAIIESVDDLLVPNTRGLVERMTVARLRRRLVASRDALDPEALRDAAVGLLGELEATPPVLAGLHLDRPDPDAVAAGVTKTYRRGRRAMLRALTDDDPAVWHEWRKRAKYHRYHTELLMDTDPDAMARHRKNCKRLTDAIGDDHDLAVLHEALAGPGAPVGRLTRHFVRRVIRRQSTGLRRQAARVGAQVFALDAGQVEADIAALWAAYRPEPADDDDPLAGAPTRESTVSSTTVAGDPHRVLDLTDTPVSRLVSDPEMSMSPTESM